MRAASGALEASLRRQGYARIAGVDEAGRGSLFGPVFAAAVILDPARPIRGLKDSKVLPEHAREELAATIRQRAAACAVASCAASEIDRLNILQASRLAMRRAVEQLDPPCDYLLADAVCVDWDVPQQSIIKGDAKVAAIAAASILAKVCRDRCLVEMDRAFPGYGLAGHKGYPTPEHREALLRLGPTTQHRFSYTPVRDCCQGILCL